MTLNDQKNLYSQAWLMALAAAAGVARVGEPSIDDDSVDMTLKRTGGAPRRSPHLEVQLKCTAVAERSDNELRYALKLKNYDDLRSTDTHVPRILVVLCVPKAVEDWISTDVEHTEIRECAYWLSLAGALAVPNESSVTVRIPLHQQLDVAAMRSIFDRLTAGERP